MTDSIVKVVKLDDIKIVNRARKDYGDLHDLTDSIRKHGIIHPIAVEETGEDTYRLLAGGRRLAASLALDLETIPVRIYRNSDEHTMKEIELLENITRKDLTYEETVSLEYQVHTLMQKKHGIGVQGAKTGFSLQDTAELLDKSKTATAESVKYGKILTEHPEIKNALKGVKTAKEAKKIINKVIKDEKTKEFAKSTEGSLLVKGVQRALINSYKVMDVFDFLDEKIKQGKTYRFIECDPPYGIDLMNVKKGLDVDDELYKEVDSADYKEFLVKLFSRLSKLLTDDGWLVFWHGIHWYNTIRTLIGDVGLDSAKVPGIWIKGVGQTQRYKTLLASSYEIFTYAHKKSAEIFNTGRANVYDFSPVVAKNKLHPTERPIEMIEELIKTFYDPSRRGEILVPFGGSGNTILAAFNLGIHACTCDLQEVYHDRYVKKVMDSELPFRSYNK